MIHPPEMIERVYDPMVVNAITNHWSIFPSISGGRTWPVDASPYVQDRRNVFLAGEWGMIVFHYLDPGRYEAHYRVLPQGRGKWALGFLLGALTWMFHHSDVLEIRCRVPRGNFAARALVRRICAKFEFTVKNGWRDEDGNSIEADVFSMTRGRWEILNANA